MTSKYFWRGVLIVALSLALSTNAEGQTGGGKIVSNGTIAGVIVGVVAAVVVVAYVVIHESSKKRSITGCVTPAENGMSVTDEKDKRSYALSGNTADIKLGDRMTLQGKKDQAEGRRQVDGLGNKNDIQRLRRLSVPSVNLGFTPASPAPHQLTPLPAHGSPAQCRPPARSMGTRRPTD